MLPLVGIMPFQSSRPRRQSGSSCNEYFFDLPQVFLNFRLYDSGKVGVYPKHGCVGI